MFDLARRARVLVPLIALVACDSQDPSPATTTNPTSTDDTSVAPTSPDASDDDTSTPTTTADTSVATTDDSSVTTAPTDTADTSVTTTDPGDTSVDPGDTTATTTAPGDTSSPGDTVVVGPTTHSLNFGGWTMNPSAEGTYCVVMRLDNETPVLVNRIRTTLSDGSHHLIVYRSEATEERRTPFQCTPFVETLGGTTVPVVISQIRDDQVQLPENVAYEFEPHQMIRLEAHYLNYYPDPITTNVDVHFDTIADGPSVQRADLIFYGNTGIYLEKGATETLPWKYYGVPQGLSVFAMTGHTHELGTNVEVEKTTSRDTAGTVVYPPPGQPFEWDEAPVAQFEPELVFAQNQGFRFRCSYHNTTNGAVTFGESAKKEMCFFWAYYYPSQGPIIRFL